MAKSSTSPSQQRGSKKGQGSSRPKKDKTKEKPKDKPKEHRDKVKEKDKTRDHKTRKRHTESVNNNEAAESSTQKKTKTDQSTDAIQAGGINIDTTSQTQTTDQSQTTRETMGGIKGVDGVPTPSEHHEEPTHLPKESECREETPLPKSSVDASMASKGDGTMNENHTHEPSEDANNDINDQPDIAEPPTDPFKNYLRDDGENPQNQHLTWWTGPVVQRQAWELQWLKAKMKPPTLGNALFNAGRIGYPTDSAPPPSFVASTLGSGMQKNAVYIRVPVPWVPMTAGPRPPPQRPLQPPPPPPVPSMESSEMNKNNPKDMEHGTGGGFHTSSWRGVPGRDDATWETAAPATSSWETGPWSEEEWQIWEVSVYGWNQPVDADEKSSEETAHKVPEPKAMPKEPTVPKVPEPKAMPVQPKEPKEVPPPEYRPEPRHPVVVPPPSPSPLTPTPPSCPPPGHVIAQQFAAPSTDGDFEYVQTDAYAEVMHRLGSWSRPT